MWFFNLYSLLLSYPNKLYFIFFILAQCTNWTFQKNLKNFSDISPTCTWGSFHQLYVKPYFSPTPLQSTPPQLSIIPHTLHQNHSSCSLFSSKCNIVTFVHNPPTFSLHHLHLDSSLAHLKSQIMPTTTINSSNVFYLPPPTSLSLPLLFF